ncbi:hypothetical protein AB0C68_40510 [Streptomyces tendae]|uniref:hypothetical protein n=1 Tax=Streptomyces tendae TaxID=1932 RepID=UPI0033F4F9AF
MAKEAERLVDVLEDHSYTSDVTHARGDIVFTAAGGNAPVTPYAPAPGAPAQLLTPLRADARRATGADLRAGVGGWPSTRILSPFAQLNPHRAVCVMPRERSPLVAWEP